MRLLKIFTFLFLFVSGATLFAQERSQNIPSEQFEVYRSVHVFPNPAAEYIHVKSDFIVASEVKLTLHNIIGNEVPAESEVVGEHELRIRVKDFTTGYYLIAVRDDKRKISATVKFLKR